MSVQSLTPELVESLRESGREVLETMCATTPKAVEAVTNESSDYSDEIIGLLGFTGTRGGTFLVRTSEAIARLISARMLMMEPEELTDFAEIADGFGELVNMISGNFKNAWVAGGNHMDLSVPNVTHNGSVRINLEQSGSLTSSVCIKLDEGDIHVSVHFEAA